MRKNTSISTKISLMLYFMIVISTLAIGVFSYVIYRSDSIRYQAQTAQGVANSYASIIDGDKFSKLISTKSADEYWYEAKEYIDAIKTSTGIKFIYSMTVVDGKIVYFTEGRTPDQTDDTFLGGTDTLDSFAAELYETLETGVPHTSGIYFSGDEYGYLVSGFAAIFDSNNKPVGVVGADLAVNKVLSESTEFGVKIFIAVTMFSIVFILMAIWYVRKNIGKPIKDLSFVSQKLADGDMDIEISFQSNDEIGNLSRDFSKIKSALLDLTYSINQMSQEQNAGDNEAFINSVQFKGVYKTVADGINAMVHQYVSDTEEFLHAVSMFGAGNFNVAIKQFPGKKSSVNEAVESLRKNLREVSYEISLLAKSAIDGDLSKRIDTERFDGDWGNLTSEMNLLMKAVAEPITESSLALNQMSQGYLDARLTGSYKGDFAIIRDSLNVTSNEISAYIREIKEILTGIAQNNLNQEITRQYVGQFIEIKDSINHIITQLNMVIGNIDSASDQVAAGASQLASSSQQLATEVNTQIGIVERLTATIEKINEQTASNAESAQAANEISTISRENALNGNKEMQKMLIAISAIKDASDNISRVIKVIEDIALQTNILALNAAIEAARVGANGKGFAVVADQVRDLSIRSQNAVKDTTVLIEASIEKVNEGTIIANSTANALDTIVANVTSVSEYIERIAASSNEQTQSIAEANKGLDLISRSAINNSATSQEASALSEELTAQADELRKLIQTFKLK